MKQEVEEVDVVEEVEEGEEGEEVTLRHTSDNEALQIWTFLRSTWMNGGVDTMSKYDIGFHKEHSL